MYLVFHHWRLKVFIMFCFPTKPERTVTTDSGLESAHRMVKKIKDEEEENDDDDEDDEEREGTIKPKGVASLQI